MQTKTIAIKQRMNTEKSVGSDRTSDETVRNTVTTVRRSGENTLYLDMEEELPFQEGDPEHAQTTVLRLQPKKWDSEDDLDSLRSSYFFSKSMFPSALMNSLNEVLLSEGLNESTVVSSQKMKLTITKTEKNTVQGEETKSDDTSSAQTLAD